MADGSSRIRNRVARPPRYRWLPDRGRFPFRFLRCTPAALPTVRMRATHQGTVRAVATMTTAATVRGSSSLDLRRAEG
jgi:hypothetical protein